MDYFNPNALVPQNDFRFVSGLGGYVAGMGLAQNKEFFERAMRDNDLGFLEKLQNYENLKAESPTKLAEYAMRQKQANSNSAILDSGAPTESGIAESQAKTSTAKTQMSNNELKRIENQGQLLSNMSEFYKQQPFNPMDKNHKDQWDEFRAQAKNVGIPENALPSVPTPQVMNMIHGKAQSFVNNIGLQQKLAEIRQTASGHLDAVKYAQDAETAREKAKREAISEQPGVDKAVGGAMQRFVNKQASPEDEQLLNQYFTTKAMGPIMNSVEAQMTVIKNMKDPVAREKAMRELMDKYKLIPQLSGKQGSQGGKVPAQSLGGRVGKKDEIIETDQGTYIWDEKRHGWDPK